MGGIALSMLLFPIAGQQIPALAAEQIYASYSPLERSISVAALETYAKTGKLDDDSLSWLLMALPLLSLNIRAATPNNCDRCWLVEPMK